MASRGSGNWALVEHQHHSRASRVYRFQILLPNGTSTGLTLKDPGEEMPLHDFLDHIRTELEDVPMDGDDRRGIDWSGDVYLEDLLDRKIHKELQFSDFLTNSTNILRLQDGEGFVRTFENMWDLTPPTELLQELPAEYSTESALADLIDNSLQALWSNGKKDRKLIRITIDQEKMVIFDTGRGMDGSDENSISKWGTIGSSNHRVFRAKGIGGKAPYLVPFFGMFGYGGTIASMHLGRRAIVSSKTKESRKVFTLHLSREALLAKSSSKLSWKTAGGVRDPSEEELTLSPHQSFTQVEIQGLNRCLEAAKLQRFLKDIYFPYIQYDEDNGSMNTRRPVQFEVNGVDLAEILENEVTVTNLHSCAGPSFILDVTFSCTSTTAANSEAHARIKCVYFPIVKGKESIDSILEMLRENASGVKENFDKFSRVSIRRLGRLLPDARWGPLPFMEPKQSKGKKAELLKRCCKRVKCFVETDAAFHPTLSKTDLAQHDLFTKALRRLDGSSRSDSSVEDVNVDVRRGGRSLNVTQLEKQYHDWINNMHAQYDVEIDEGDNDHTVIINPSNKDRLGISEDVQVIRVYTSVRRKGKTWKRGDHLKIQPGVLARLKNNFLSLKTIFYATLEYVVGEGLAGDICGEARLICRSIEFSDKQGCLLEEGPDSMCLNIQESVSFPISMIDNDKCHTMENDSWRQILGKKKEKAPACIEVLRNLQGSDLTIERGLPFEKVIMAGYKHPREIIAVILPQCATTCSTSPLDKRYILKDDEIEMEMDINHLPGSKKDHLRANCIYRKLKKPSSRDSINGLYIFQLSEDSSIFTKSGVYQFIFSVRCKDSSIITHETEITVRPNSNTRRWQLSSIADCSAGNAVVNIRLGVPVRCLGVRSHDSYGNAIPFQDIRKAVITIVDGNYILAQVEDIEVELSSDSMTLNIRDFLFKSSKLDIIRPKYEAMLKISLSDNEFSHLCPCKVMPGLPSTINMDMCLAWEKNLTPGEVIDDALLEVFDHCGNHVEEGTELIVEIVGFSFVDKHGHVRKVNSEGFVDLSGLLKVINGFGSQACLKIFHHEKEIFATTFQISIRNLEAVEVPRSCQAGTLLENIIFEVFDSDGLIDESMHGPHHTLSIRSNEKLVEGAQYTFERGRCIVSRVPVPREPGTVTFVAYHTHFPDLETTIQIPVYTLDLVPVKGENESEPICSYPTSSVSSQNTKSPSQLVLSQSNSLASNILGKFSDEIRAIDSDICSQEVLIKAFDSRKKTLENDIVNLQDEISHTAGSATGAIELTRHKIEENVGTAAAVLCTLSSRQCLTDDVVGIVALLGTVADRKMSRMLSLYLGEDNMLAVVCKTQAAANYFEKYAADGSVDVHFGIHQEAANLGAPIRKRFPIICLDLIRPYTGGFHLNTKQKPLALPFPHSKGFRGFAVNMINLSPESLTIVTKHGHGLRETLFYRLFGELQVYETRDDMWQAIRHLKNGAISLDGGIIKGDGMLILGYSDPEVTFPVVPRAALDVEEDNSEYVCNKIKTMHAQIGVVKTLENRISAAEEQRQKLVMERNEKKRKFDQISEVLSQASGSSDHQFYE
ncbi:structural maintenance of chromosomes flexible hinge domain-containing protein GMI1 isoform X2 [Lolium perenne]|uniref:structural maintenance of chromosomes flexible hinge domain-containing protein GMI1 isoform X2 n=1 Tax=Lolium perenne TaxID=4522 RepID=UPI0021F5A24C|nr:structural maintenance of chromosomes flexible hinge domain-containing protein GMI1-like isoform X2 [Lolium perenne]